jgi:hypothetical protein
MITYGRAGTTNLFVYLAIIACLGLFVGRVRAEEAELSEEYKVAINKAIAEFDAKHWSEAIVLFQKAHSLNPNARTSRGMGLAAFEEQHYLDATKWLTEALESPVQPLTERMRADTLPILERAKEYLGSYDLNNDPAELTIEIDGHPATIQDGKLMLDAGDRRLIAKAQGYEPMERSLFVRAGNNGILGIKLEPVQQIASVTEQQVRHVKPIEKEEDETDVPAASSSSSNVVPWVLIGTGAAMAIGGGILFGLSLNDRSNVENANRFTPEIKDAKKRVPVLSGVGIPLFSVGVAVAVVGTVLLVSGSGSTNETAAQSGLQLRAGLGSVSVTGGF